MRRAIFLAALAAAGCASPPRAAPVRRPPPSVQAPEPVVVAPAPDSSVRVASLRESRRTWPSVADREQWIATLAAFDASTDPTERAHLAARLEQLDGIYRVGEAARRRP